MRYCVVILILNVRVLKRYRDHPGGNGLDSLPEETGLAFSKSKAFADDKFNITQNIKNCLLQDRKYCVDKGKCWLPAFPPFPTVFSKAFFFTKS